MSVSYDLFLRWTAHKGLRGDREGMAALGLSHGTAHHWKNGRNAAAHIVERMAKDLGEDPTGHIIAVFQETAKGPDARTLQRMAKRLGYGALVAVSLAIPAPHSAAKGAGVDEPGIYIMRTGRKSRKLRKRVRMGEIAATHKGQSAHASALEVRSCCKTFPDERSDEATTLPYTGRKNELLRAFGLRRRGGRQARPERGMDRMEVTREFSYIAR